MKGWWVELFNLNNLEDINKWIEKCKFLQIVVWIREMALIDDLLDSDPLSHKVSCIGHHLMCNG